MSLTIKELQKIDDKKNKIKKDTYTHIYDDCCRKIRSAASLNEKQIFLKIQKYVFGYPTFNVEKATAYIKRQLVNGGFHVVQLSSDELYVSWTPVSKKSEPVVDNTPEETLPNLINLKKLARKYKP